MQAAEQRRAEDAVRSPGLDQFRKNPFRALRLAQSATPQQALWQGEKILARVRSGAAIADPDLIPWLAPATELEIMDAMQTIESPLARLVEQMLWFDFDGDPRGAELRDALAAQDAARLHAYLMAGSEGPLAARCNQVNLRLLIGFSELRGVGPRVLPASEPAEAAPSWTRDGALEVIEDVHAAIRAQRALDSSWSTLLADALLAWSRLLKYPDVLEDLRARLAMLGLLDGERVGEDDAEAVCRALWTRLADLIAGETRLELQRGALENAARLAELARNSEIDAEIWLVASRPLRTQFQAELAALEPGAATGGGALADIAAYLDRLGALIARWRTVDTANLLWLATPVDEAVGEVLGRLRGLEGKQRGVPAYRTQVERLRELATARSLRERVKSFLVEVKQEPYPADVLATATCHFCRQRRGMPGHAAALVVRPATARFGDSDGLRAWPVARCAACAELHRRIFGIGQLALISCLVACALFTVLTPMATGWAVLAVLTGLWLALGVRRVVRRKIAAALTPAGDRRFDDRAEAEAVSAAFDGGVLGDLVYVERDGAWQRIGGGLVPGMYGQPSAVAAASALGMPVAAVLYGAMYLVAWLARSAGIVVLGGAGLFLIGLLLYAAAQGGGRILIFVVFVIIEIVIGLARDR